MGELGYGFQLPRVFVDGFDPLDGLSPDELAEFVPTA